MLFTIDHLRSISFFCQNAHHGHALYPNLPTGGHGHYLLANFNSGLYRSVVFLDLKKAFDTVDLKVLLNKLQRIGVQGSNFNWFESYLSNRQHVTKIGELISGPAFVNVGVLQGSILWPLFFTFYINSLSSVITNPKAIVSLYAGDTAFFCQRVNLSVTSTTLWILKSARLPSGLTLCPLWTQYCVKKASPCKTGSDMRLVSSNLPYWVLLQWE